MAVVNKKEPLVSVVTPVFNGERYLGECIQSVLQQTYSNLEYIIVNNCSSDGSREIAERYAKDDPRLRLIDNTVFLKQIANFNKAVKMISKESIYCCLLMADDWIFPEFVERKVRLAMEYPSIGIVSSYRLVGRNVRQVNIQYNEMFFPGHETARKKLLREGGSLFGSTSTFLFKSEIVRKEQDIFDESEIHADIDFVIRQLREYDFGFVHQILSYTREHPESTTQFCDLYGTNLISFLNRLRKYGNTFLNKAEYKRTLNRLIKLHHKKLAEILFSNPLHFGEIWRYHRKEMARIDIDYNWPRMIGCLVSAPPKRLLKAVLRRGKLRQGKKLFDKEFIRLKKDTTSEAS